MGESGGREWNERKANSMIRWKGKKSNLNAERERERENVLGGELREMRDHKSS